MRELVSSRQRYATLSLAVSAISAAHEDYTVPRIGLATHLVEGVCRENANTSLQKNPGLN